MPDVPLSSDDIQKYIDGADARGVNATQSPPDFWPLSSSLRCETPRCQLLFFQNVFVVTVQDITPFRPPVVVIASIGRKTPIDLSALTQIATRPLVRPFKAQGFRLQNLRGKTGLHHHSDSGQRGLIQTRLGLEEQKEIFGLAHFVFKPHAPDNYLVRPCGDLLDLLD